MNGASFLGWIIACLLTALVGRNRKIGYGWTLVFCIFLSPLIGLIIGLCSKKKGTEFIDVDNNR